MNYKISHVNNALLLIVNFSILTMIFTIRFMIQKFYYFLKINPVNFTLEKL